MNDKTKKITALVLTALLSLSLSSCSGDKDKESSTSSQASTSSQQTSTSSDIPSSSLDSTSSDTSSAAETIVRPAPDDATIAGLENEKKGWGPGYNVDSNNCPVSATDFNKSYNKYEAYAVGNTSSNGKRIYLTFDEGYENGYTEKILDVLKEKNVSATFFVTLPYIESEPELIQRMIDEGHTIGNHSNHHKSMPTLDSDTCVSEIDDVYCYLKEHYGYETTYFRPPMGEYSARSLALTQKSGHKTLLWSFAYKDWLTDDQPDPEEAYKRITEATHDGAIYLLHAVSKTNTELLPRLIDYWRAEGYTIAKMDL